MSRSGLRARLRARHAALALSMLLGAGILAPRSLGAHPIHSTMTQMTLDPRTGRATISIRVFADDFATAVARAEPRAPHADSAMLRYVRARFSLANSAGRPVSIAWCGARRAGEVVFLCLHAVGITSLAGATLRNGLFREMFDDQVNVVQAVSDGRRQTLLFTRRDAARRLS